MKELISLVETNQDVNITILDEDVKLDMFVNDNPTFIKSNYKNVVSSGETARGDVINLLLLINKVDGYSIWSNKNNYTVSIL